MPTAPSRAALSLALALLVTGCVEIEVHRTLAPDGSGEQTITMRVPQGAAAARAAAEPYTRTISGAPSQPPPDGRDGDAVIHVATARFPDVASLRHQAEFLTSGATVTRQGDGRWAYREILLNGYLKALKRAPTDERKVALEAAMRKARTALGSARLTYTIEFPGKVLKANADRIDGNQAAWDLRVDKLFHAPALELTALYEAPRPVQIAVAPPAGTAPVANEAPPPADPPARPAPVAEAPRPEPKAPPAPARAAPEPVATPAPEPVATPAEPPVPSDPPAPPAPVAETEPEPPARAAELDGVLLAQADEPAAPAAPAAAPAPPEAPDPLEPTATDDDTTRLVKESFGKALAHIDRREYREAAAELQKAIAAKPSNKLIADLYAITVAKFRDAALKSGDPELAAEAKRLQDLAYKGRIASLRDPARMKKLIKDIRTGTFPVRTWAMEELVIAGDYAVPYLIAMILEDTDTVHRAYGEHVLSRLRGPAVPAIAEALKHTDPLIRQILIHSLASIGDPRSMPYLLALAQDPKGHPLVVASAKAALGKIAADPTDLRESAPEAFVRLAQHYYYQNKKVLLPLLYEHLVWRWDPHKNELTREAVPRHLYPYRMAQEMARNALLVNPKFEPAVPLIICAYFAQHNLLETFYTAAEGRELTEDEARDAALAAPIRRRLRAAPLVAHAAGKKFVYAALERSLRDGRADVAISCINALREIADGAAIPGPPLTEDELRGLRRSKTRAPAKRKRSVVRTWYGPKDPTAKELPPPPPNPDAIPLDGSPIVSALSYAKKHVRYAAAGALVDIAPQHLIRDADRVAYNLAEAISETAVRVALLVDEDETSIDHTRGLLIGAGVDPELARDERDALAVARRLPPKDVLILNATMQKAPVAKVLASLRAIPAIANVPAILITTSEERLRTKQAFAGQNVEVLARPLDAKVVKAALDLVLKKAPAAKGEALTVESSSAAARALAAIDPATSIFNLRAALPALAQAVASTNQPDAVRIPAAEAIRHIGDKAALPYLVSAYNSPKSSKELRLAVLDAIGACSAALRELPATVDDVFTRASYDDDFDFRRTAARAFGRRGGAGTDFLKTVEHLHGIKPRGKE